MPARAGFVPVLVSVKTSVVAPPSAIVPAPKVFATDGVPAVTTRHTSAEVLLAPVEVTLARVGERRRVARAARVGLRRLVGEARIVIVQLAVPALIAMPVRPESTRVPLV
jgi:hypothetical protein